MNRLTNRSGSYLMPLLASGLLMAVASTGVSAENRIDCYADANGFHTYLQYDGEVGVYKGRLIEPLKVRVSKNEEKIQFQSPVMNWFKYYIDRDSGEKFSSHQLSTDPNDFEWVKVAKCELPGDLSS